MRPSSLIVAGLLSTCATSTDHRAPEPGRGVEFPQTPARPASLPPPAARPADPSEVEARARAAFLALEPHFAAHLALTFDTPQRLKSVLHLKMQGLSMLVREYTHVAVLGAPEWALAATVRMAMAYEDTAQTLRDAAAPPGLTDEQLALYRSELQQRAVPLDEKAGEHFERAVALGGPPLSGSDWLRYARERLAHPAEATEPPRFDATPAPSSPSP